MKLRKVNKRIMRYSAGATGGVAAILGAKKLARAAVKDVSNNALRILMTDIYDENMYELVSSITRMGIKQTIEGNMRATQGRALSRPLGTPKKLPSLDSLVLSFAQLYTMPTSLDRPIDLGVVIGKQAKKPLHVKLPILIAPMGYGVSLSKNVKIALAASASMAGIAINSGEGPVLKEEKEAAEKYIYQYHRAMWGNRKKDLTSCNAIEINFGQGSTGGVGHMTCVKDMDPTVRREYGFSKNQCFITSSRHPEVEEVSQLPKLVEKLKKDGNGVPVGAKIAAGKQLEADLDILCSSGVDYVVVSGAEASTKGSSPTLQDDFGVPTIFAIHRAAQWLRKNGYKDRVSLIVDGKIRTPGEILKAIALGADACYIGSIALFAMSHKQILKALPYEPPTQLMWHQGQYEKQFNAKEGTASLSNFLNACKAELEEGVKALGKTGLGEVDRKDLSALDEMVARGCKIPMVYEAFEYDQHDLWN